MRVEAEVFKRVQPFEYLKRFVSGDTRPDGRTFMTARELRIQEGPISTSLGSATVRIGKTTVVCGIKGEIAQTLATEPEKGFFVPNVDLGPIAGSEFKPGPPGVLCQAVSHQIYKLIDETVLDLSQLVIEKGERAWVLWADMVCIEYDGAILDACLASLLQALKSVVIPDLDGMDLLETGKPLEIKSLPISLSFSIFNSILLVDPTGDELQVSDGTFSIVYDGSIRSIVKPGGHPVSNETLKKAILITRQRYQSLTE
ncbi:exosome complex exonuclease RRP43-like protein [Gorgonomyces haynaldii]|nr:exosome complex exonuclease RRP43-like protein [Gorgonomyces haynaldii]